MEKMLRIPLAMMVSVLSVFLVAGGAAADCPTIMYTSDCGCVASTPGKTYKLGNHMVCTGSSYGIIIGASGVTIDGDGYSLTGPGYAELNCAVNVRPEDDSDRIWCEGHPCRCADISSQDNIPTTCDGCLPSGILNADPDLCTDANGCVGGGGFDRLTVQNLEITGWCDGIFISGDCVPVEKRLIRQVIEGNYIHDNGNPDCGNYIAAVGGDGGDWQYRNYNDAIFTAQVGMSAFAAGDPAPCTECVKGTSECPDLNEMDFDVCVAQSPARNLIRFNRIENQKGCGCVSCPGGNGINLQGGLEITNIIWSGCNEIAGNICRDCDMSGIQYSHATTSNRIHDNTCENNGFGGITDPCGWCDDNFIYSNNAYNNGGVGIGLHAVAMVMKNKVCGTTDLSADPNLSLLGYPCGGIGILLGQPTGKLINNVSCKNAASDMTCMNGPHTDTHSPNRCSSETGFGDDACTYDWCNLTVCP